MWFSGGRPDAAPVSFMANRALGFGFVLMHEDPRLSGVITSDSGGKTRWGISERAYPNFWEDGKIPTLEDAANIFLHYYWVPLLCDEIPNQDVANRLVDAAFNMGRATAVRLFQRSLGMVDEAIDGEVGHTTMSYVLRLAPATILNTFCNHLEGHYRELADNNPSYAKYLHGWLARIA